MSTNLTPRTTNPATDVRTTPTTRPWLALGVLMLPVLLISIDNTVLTFALPQLSAALRPTGNELLWIIDSYPLVLAALLVPMGSLADRFGRRRLLLIGALGFAGVSALAAFAPNAAALVTARVALAFFGAMLMPSTLSLLRNIFTDRDQRRIAIAIWAAGFAAGGALGPIVGGYLLEHFWWGSVFLLAVPFLIPLLVLAPMFVPESRDPNPGPVDLPSTLLAVAGLGGLVYTIKAFASQGFTTVTVATGGLAALAIVAFVRRQLTRANPMLDVRLFSVPAFSGAVVINLLSVFSLVGFLFFISQDLQLVLGLGPSQAGTALLPGLAAMVIAGLLVVPVVARVRPAVVVAVSMLLAGIGYLVVGLNAGSNTVAMLAAAFAVLAVGIGAGETISNELILSSVPAPKAGAASAVSETAYELGAVLGTAVLGSILTAHYRSGVSLPSTVSGADAAAARETLGGAVEVAATLPPAQGSALLESAQTAFSSGVSLTATIGAVLMVLAAGIAMLTLRHEK